ncbi:unnamed protein product [Echinostoma caproni]|uniref:4-alpha-glucanotransferase n=1 Tax=Echinostoma caproni TaxID=27848 RepID=A0A183A423_9TREM|nr:unnamed protein product [Echinostoma caproni]
MEKTGRLAQKWRLWRTQYADFRALTETDREFSSAQLAFFRHTIGLTAPLIINGFTHSPHEESKDWQEVMSKKERYCFGASDET